MQDRTTLSYKITKALRDPGRIVPFAKRYLRNRRFARSSTNHLEYYGKIIDERAATNPDEAVGSETRESWLEFGKLQFDYLVKHGLRPDHDVLELGCGNLRAGWQIINYTNEGKYTGVDISPGIIIAAEKTLIEHKLTRKRPYLYYTDNTDLEFLPESSFDIVHAHGVYTQCPIDVIKESIASVSRLLKPTGFFDFTFNEVSGAGGDFLREDFYYNLATILDLSRSCGLVFEVMKDWSVRPQTKIRARLPDGPA